MTLDEKIEFTHAKADTLLKRVRCCTWFFLVTGVWFVGNAVYSFKESREWARFIAVSGGQFPWPTPPEEREAIMREHGHDAPTFAEFDLYEAMLLTSVVTLVMGVVALRYACIGKRIQCNTQEKFAKHASCKGVILFVIFLLAYGGSKHSCAKLMSITADLKGNSTEPHQHHNREGRHGHDNRKLQAFETHEVDFEERMKEMDEAWDTMMTMQEEPKIFESFPTPPEIVYEMPEEVETSAEDIWEKVEEYEEAAKEADANELMRTFEAKMYGRVPKKDGAKPEHSDDYKGKFGMCPIMAILIVAQLVYVYTLRELKHCYISIRMFQKAKELVAKNAVIRDEEFKSHLILSNTTATELDNSADSIEALAPEDKAGAPNFSYKFEEPAALPKYGQPLIKKSVTGCAINTSV